MKFISLVLVVFMVIGLVGCSESEKVIERHPESDVAIATALEIATRQQYAYQFELGDVINNLTVIRYFGTFDEASLLILAWVDEDGVISANMALWREEVGGLTFRANVWLPILVYYENNFLTLTDAFMAGIIDLAVLQEVYTLYNQS